MRTLRKRRGLSPGCSSLESLEEEKPQSKPRADWVGGTGGLTSYKQSKERAFRRKEGESEVNTEESAV